MKPALNPLLALLLLLPLGACRSTWYGARFAPAANAVLVDASQSGGRASALISVRGVRRADREAGEPARVELRMRLENPGQVPFHLQQHSLELLSGDLLAFGPARIQSSDPPRVEPGGAAVIELHFPMPTGKSPDDVHFDALHLRFSLDFEGEIVTTGVQFERREYPPYDYGYPYYHSHFSLGLGYYGH